MIVYMQMISDKKGKAKFAQLYKKYIKLMYARAYDILHDHRDAEDAVSDALEAIAKNFSKISEIDDNKMRSYFVIVTENKAIDIYRAKRRYATVNYDEAFMGVQIQEHEMSALAQAMARLPRHYQDVLLLKYDNGFSSKEIAKMLGMSDNAVRQLLHRAKGMLAKEFEREEAEE